MNSTCKEIVPVALALAPDPRTGLSHLILALALVPDPRTGPSHLALAPGLSLTLSFATI